MISLDIIIEIASLCSQWQDERLLHFARNDRKFAMTGVGRGICVRSWWDRWGFVINFVIFLTGKLLIGSLYVMRFGCHFFRHSATASIYVKRVLGAYVNSLICMIATCQFGTSTPKCMAEKPARRIFWIYFPWSSTSTVIPKFLYWTTLSICFFVGSVKE